MKNLLSRNNCVISLIVQKMEKIITNVRENKIIVTTLTFFENKLLIL